LENSSPDAFLSNLEKNQELKAFYLEETPWVLQAKNESENKKRVGLLFDLNKMSHEQTQAFKKLQKNNHLMVALFGLMADQMIGISHNILLQVFLT
jgi:hypothetical protein